jgi:TM2 domain-containing membrane protein YozV
MITAPPPPHVLPKSPGAALVLSVLWPGLGSIYADHVTTGVLLIIANIVSLILCLVLIGFVTTPILYIVALALAYTQAQEWNRQHGIIS